MTRPGQLDVQWLVYGNVAALTGSLFVVLNALRHYSAWGDCLVFGQHYQQGFISL